MYFILTGDEVMRWLGFVAGCWWLGWCFLCMMVTQTIMHAYYYYYYRPVSDQRRWSASGALLRTTATVGGGGCRVVNMFHVIIASGRPS